MLDLVPLLVVGNAGELLANPVGFPGAAGVQFAIAGKECIGPRFRYCGEPVAVLLAQFRKSGNEAP